MAGCTEHTGHSDVAWTALTSSNTSISGTKNYYLSGDLSLSKTITVNRGCTLNLCLNGYTLTFTGSSGSVISAMGGTLNLCDCSAEAAGTITEGKKNPGGGVYSSGGVFTMYGGNITNNGGGGVYSDYKFTMSAGSINGNTANASRLGGGGVYNYQGSVTITGGSVIGNTAFDSSKSVYDFRSGTYAMMA